MNKSKYGKLSIIIILIATLFISAAIAIFGLSKTNGATGANSSAEISAPEKDASSAIVDGEQNDDGTIVNPEVEAKATADVSSSAAFMTAITNFNSGSSTSLTLNITGSFTLTSTFTVNSGKSIEILTTSNGTYINVTAGCITVDGTLSLNGYIQFLRINGGVDTMFNVRTGGTLNLKGASSIQHSGASSSHGGGVAVSGGTFNMSDGAQIYGCTAGNGGGAVYIWSGTFNMTGGTIHDNTTSGSGGGVFVGSNGTFNMKGTSSSPATIRNNTSSVAHYTNTGGGGVWSDGTFNMSTSNSYITSNSATNSRGGGVGLGGGTFTMSAGYIGGTASGAGNRTPYCGGGVYVYSGTFKMTGSSAYVYGNTAYDGGGVYIYGGAFTKSGGYVGNEGVSGSGNTATNNGGGVYINGGTFTHTGGEIDLNKAKYGGGVYLIGGTTNFSSGWIDGNTATYNGGGVNVATGATFNMTGGYIGHTNYHNTTSGEGAGVRVAGGTFNMSAGNIQYNNATGTSSDGGGICVNGGKFTMTGGSVHSNSAYRNGGGIRIQAADSVSISGTSSSKTTIHANTANQGDGYGGGISVNAANSFSIGDYTEIYGNTGKLGGGIHTNVSFSLSNSTRKVYNNTASSNGGGIYILSGASVTIGSGSGSGAEIYSNTAASGGGVYISNGTLTQPFGSIYGNSATYGGGVYVSGSSATYGFIYGSVGLSGNPNKAQNGAGIYNGGGTFSMHGGTLGYNQASGNGGGLYNASGTTNMDGGTVSQNTVTSDGGGVYIRSGTFNFTGGTLAANTAVRGGGVFCYSGTFTFNGGTIGGSSANANTATQYGGGVYLDTSWTPTKGTISYNKSTGAASSSYGGGGVAVGGGYTFTLNTANVVINNNTATGYGGGVLAFSSATFTMSGGNLRHNSAASGGGVAVLGSAKLTQSGGTIGGSSNGNSATYGGGVFVNSKGTINLSGGTISYNGASSGGAGVYLYSGTITQRNTVSNNSFATSSSYGGGVYLRAGTYNLSAGSISNNEVANSSVGGSSYGGGVYIAGGTFNLNGGTVSGNTVTGAPGTHAGGGIYLNGGALNISSGYVTGNSAVNPNSATGYGGGVYANGGTFTLSGGYLRSNSAAHNGGGVYVNGSATFRMTGGTIGGSGNANGAEYGGGVYLNSSTAATISAGTISYNNASYGGGVYVNTNRSLTVSGTANISYNQAGNGGGLYVAGTLTLSGGSVYCNSAYDGGGMYANGGTITMNGGTVGGSGSTYANHAANSGGGVYIASGTFNMSAGTVSYNTATYAAGIYTAGTTSLTGTAVVSNNTASSSGGGVSNYGSGTLTINGANVEIRNNICNVTTAGYGGGMYVYDGTVNFVTGKINDNNATYGGGVFVQGGTFNMNGGEIDGNTAIRNGGGVYLNPNGTLNLTNGAISNNAAQNSDSSGTGWGYGGGIASQGTAVINGENVSIFGNSAVYGGGVTAIKGNMTFTKGTITGNTASNGGGGAEIGSTATFTLNGGKITVNQAGWGGGVFNLGTMTMSSGEITDNITLQFGGGGIQSGNADTAPTVTVSGGLISGNISKTTGGAAYVASGEFNISGGEISGNTAAHAGGVWVVSGKLGVTGGVITANESNDPEGVGVHVADGGSLELGDVAYIYDNMYRGYQNNVFVESQQAVTFSGTLADGAKIGIIAIENLVLTDGFTTAGHTQADIAKYFSSDIHGLTLKYENDEIVVTYDIETAWNETVQASLDNGTTEIFILYYDWTAENGAFGDSSGVGFYGTGTILVPDQASVIFDFNDKTVDGAGATTTIMRVEGELVLDTFGTGVMTGGNSSDGGAIYVAGGNLTLENGTVKGNTASYGGGVYLNNGGSFDMNGGEISANTAERGAGVYVSDGTFNLAGGTIGGSGENKNTATSYGGGVYVAGGGIFTVEKVGEVCAISGNEAQRGAGVYVDGGRFTLEDGEISQNIATTDGGAIYIDSGVVALNGGSVANNEATNGAGMYVAAGEVAFDGAQFDMNIAEYGGGVYVAGGNVTMSDGIIGGSLSQFTALYGGGVYVNGGTFNITGGEISENKAGEGGNVYVASGEFGISGTGYVYRGTVDEGSNGGGIYLKNGSVNIAGSISDCFATNGGAVYVEGGELRLSDGANISACVADSGAGIYLAGGTATISGGSINTSGAQRGGGVYVAGGTLDIRGGNIRNNWTNTDDGINNGAGIYVADGNVTMSGGDISYNTTANCGGAIYVYYGNISLTGGTISGNAADTLGAGLYVNNGTVTIDGAAISNNTAEEGGAIYAAGGGITFASGEISDNTAEYCGGVLLASGATFEMNGGAISGNNSTTDGGVSVGSGATFEMNGGEISGNVTSNGYGGGVYVYGGTFTLNSGEISGNTAINGAGLYVGDSGSSVTLIGGKITNNATTGATTTYGGGVYVAGGVEVNITGACEISGNSATLGGGIYVNEGTVNLVSGTISENTASSGGGIYINAGAVEMTGGSIINNNSTDATETAGGGGVFVLNGALTVSGNSKINENTSARNGGGIRIDGATDSSTVEITEGSLSENTAAIGGGVYVTGSFAALTLGGSVTVSDNTATTNGGAVAAFAGATVDVTDNAFVTKNSATLNGGAVYLTDNGTSLTVSDKGSITYNTANYGGGVYATANSAFTLVKGSLSFNEATISGGAVYVNGATLAIENGEVLGNKAATNGGAVYVAAGTASAFTMTGGTIGGAENSANTAAIGGGVYIAGGNVIITSGSISGNTATTNGGGVYFNAGTLSFEGNPIISGNKLQDSDSNLYLYNGKTVNITGKLTDGALIGLTGTGKVTEGYTTNGNGEDEKAFFFGDVVGAVVAIVGGEIHLQISLEDAWNAAVQASYDNGGKAVTFVLAETWRADTDGAFGDGAGIGFTDTGALYLPAGSYIILNLNGYTINRNLGTATAEGSVFYVKGTLEISGTTGYVTGGNATNGGGVYVQEDGAFKMNVGNIQNNVATNCGGGVYVDSGASFELTDGAIRGNRANVGGGVYVKDGGEFTMKGGAIGGTGYANTAENGAGVYTVGASKMTGGYIRNNTATGNGGGVYVAGGEFIADGGYIGGTAASFANDAAAFGGGIFLKDGEVTVSGTIISYNTALEGGGINAEGGNTTVSGGEISNNTADYGAAIIIDGATLTMGGGKITGNTANNGESGVSIVNGATFEMNGGEISNGNMGGVYVYNATFTLNDGRITGNSAVNGAGVYVCGDTGYAGGVFTMTGGEISGNSATNNGSGVYISDNATFDMTGGEISGNNATVGGGIYANKATVTLNGGKIAHNDVNGSGGGVYATGGTLTVSGTVEISGNNATVGGGVITVGTNAFTMNGGKISGNRTQTIGGAGVYFDGGEFTMSGGEISGNTSATNGGGVYVGDNKQFVLDGGLISANKATDGAGVYIGNAATLTMNGGEISSNEATGNGGGVNVSNGASFVMDDGEITANQAANGAGVYIATGGATLRGGEITANAATGQGGGVYVESGATLQISGSPVVMNNTANGVENNVFLKENKEIIIVGALSVNGIVAWIGVTMEKRRRFTSGFTTNNGSYTPALKPETVFFSDDTDYKVSLDDGGEATLGDNDYSQTALVWQFSKDGTNWINIDSPEYSLKYKKDEEYTVRALDVSGNEVAFTWAKDGDDNDITGAFKGIGSYKFVINSDEYTNPALTFEILPATLIWQYSADEGKTWFDVTSDTMVYTGATYNVRACVYYSDYELVQAFTDTMKDVGGYEYTVTDANLYGNPTLNITITTRYITVEWNFGDALGNAADGYYWEYDGYAHTPVAILNGVSNELAGVDLSYDYARSGSTTNTPTAQAYAGAYTLTVGLTNADSNIVLSNTSVQYKINGVTLSLVWTDEEGNEGDEFTFGYDSEAHGLKYKLSGVITGDTVEPQITYSTRSGKVLSGAPSAVGFYTATVKLPADCYNYVFDKVYTCQIEITQKSIAVEWTPNKDGTFNWTFNGLGQGPVAKIINPYTGEALNEAYKIEYAPVASNGNVGQYTTTQPVNAGNYIVRITLNNEDANYVLDGETTTQKFTIKKLDVEVTWKGATYDADKDVYFWEYDGNEHDLEAEISLIGLGVHKDGAILDYLGIERTDGKVKLVSVGSSTATIVLLNDPFNANFNITNSTSQVYEVRKAVINSVTWTDKFRQEFIAGDDPTYDFGSISGVYGPAYEATAINGSVILTVTYSKTYAGDWVVDETVGYKAYARLSSADAANYEFADHAEYVEFTFFIKSVGGYKQDIDVTWVVFINEFDYVALDQYITDGGFTYNGNVQYPTPMRVNEDGSLSKLGENISDYLNMNSVGADAGKYTARLKPSSVYNIKEEDFTCEYEIKKLDISISWQDGQYDSNTTFTYVYNGGEQAPYAYVDGAYDFAIDVTVKGKTNAGSHTATAEVSKNFNITSGKTQEYTISKLGLPASLVEWDWNTASGNATDGYYWIYDGNEHAPTAKIPAQNWGGDYDLVLVITGNTSEIGKHNAYAVLNSSVAAHNNFYLTGTASASFEIAQVKAGKVYWEGADGASYEDGTANATKLVFTYNGNPDGQAPKAYYIDGDNQKVYLTVTVIGGTAVNAGTYSAYVSSDLDFDSAIPTCTFKIKPMEITVTWDDATGLVFNGEEQSPAVTLSDGADGNALVKGTDYEVTAYKNAGRYTFEIKFINANYTCADSVKTFESEIKKITLTGNEYAWDTADGYDAATGTYSWVYDGNEHAPALTVSYDMDGDGVEDVTFVIGYMGATSEVGAHTVTAYIKSATYNGEDIKENFTFDADMDKDYVIKAVSVTIDWDWSDAQTGTDDNGDTYYFWTYDGNAHAPKAYLLDADGNRIQKDGADLELTVYGAETNARDGAYTVTAVVPPEYDFSGDATHEYFIKKATIEVNWVFTDTEGTDLTAQTGADGKTYYEWTYGTDVTAKAYIRNADGSNGTELQITGFETDAGAHTLTVMQNDGNYTFANASDASMSYVVKPKTAYVIWYGVGGYDEATGTGDMTNFKWPFVDNDTPLAPTAYLAYKDTNGDLQLILDKDGKAIRVEVSGAGTEIGTHTAQAVDTFVNYDFDATDAAAYTKTFEVLAKDLADSNFKWNAEGAQVSGDATNGFIYTYEYSGQNNLPVPTSDVEDLEFNITIKDAAGNTKLNITEVGTYTVTVTSRDGNYAVPADLATITVIVTAKTVEVEWDESELVYNGEAQKPKAYYTDVAGNKVPLTVTVNAGDGKDAGTTYTATATLTSTNYVLDATTSTTTYEIAQKEIKVEWTWTDVDYTGKKEHVPVPEIKLTASEKDGITKIVYKITDKDGNVVAGDGEKVKDAGEYKIKLTLQGPAAGNYKLDVAEYTFNINKKALTVTADDKSVTYGQNAPAYTATFEGLIAEEADAIKAELADVLQQWLSCSYINTTVPGTYTIYIDASWLSEHVLTNYDVTGVNGTLTVNPAEGTLIWKGDSNNGPDFAYNGTANLPVAYYFDANGTRHNLTVKYATFDGTDYAVVADPAYEAVEVDTYYAVIVDANGNVIKGDGNYTFPNFGTSFKIVKRKITVNVKDLTFTYGEIKLDELADKLGLDNGWNYGDVLPVQGDNLEISLKINGAYDGGDYLESGKYAISVGWNSATYGDSYEIEVKYAGEHDLTVEKAEITVNYDKKDDKVYDAYGILEGTNGYTSDFITDTKDFLTLAGYQDANVTAYFKPVDDSNIAPEDDHYGADVDPVTAEGEYLYNFMISVDNHETLYGRLLVKVGYADDYLYITVTGKTLEQTYGYETAADLAKYLLENGYANYDETVNAQVSMETFLTWVTAKVLDGNGNEVSGKIGVGTYKVIFALNENADARYSIYKASSRTVTLEITKFVIDLDWGNEENLNYTFDGNTHMPVITVANLTDEVGNPVTLKAGENVITVNGEKVKVIVTVDGDLTAAGAHSVLVTVESDNFEVKENSSLRSVSIKGPAEVQPVAGVGLEDWQLWLIIAAAIVMAAIIIALVIVLVKRRQASDDDGFYDPVDESDL